MINLYKFLIVFVCCVFLNFTYGQQRFINNLRLFNDMMMNPAKIMENHGFSIYASHRQQFWKLGQNSPRVTVVGAKFNLKTDYSQNMLFNYKKRIGTNYNSAIGGYYINSFTGGVFQQNEICGQFAVQWKLGQTLDNPTKFKQLNLGISIKGINNRYAANSIYLYDQNDPMFNATVITNKYAISAVPGVQFINDAIHIDGFYTFGTKDQQFASLTFMGSPKLEGFLNQSAFRVNYFGNPNVQLSFNKIHDLGSGSSNQVWSFNYGVSAFLGQKFGSNSSIVTNPGLFFGILYRTEGSPYKRTADFKKPSRKNVFKGAVNLFDANLNTIALGPSAEAGLVYSNNSEICECDRIFSKFYVEELKKTENLELLKKEKLKFTQKCQYDKMYEKSYVKYITYINSTIKELEDLQISKQELKFDSCTYNFNNQEWFCKNLSYDCGGALKFVSSQEEWDRLSPNQACYCYVNFDEKNKSLGYLYNSRAFKTISINSDIKKSGFRVASKTDWDTLFQDAYKYGKIEELYNCSGYDSANGFNLKGAGYFEDSWYTPDMNICAYWISEENVYSFSCDTKSEIMQIEISNEDLKNRLQKSAFMIRLIKE